MMQIYIHNNKNQNWFKKPLQINNANYSVQSCCSLFIYFTMTDEKEKCHACCLDCKGHKTICVACLHIMCSDCTLKWMERQMNSTEPYSCPNCMLYIEFVHVINPHPHWNKEFKFKFYSLYMNDA